MYKRLNHNLLNMLLLFILSSFWFLFSNIIFKNENVSFNPNTAFLFLNLVFLIAGISLVYKTIKDIIYYKESEPEFESETEFTSIKSMLLLFLGNILLYGLILSVNKYYTVIIDNWKIIFTYYSFIAIIFLVLISVLIVAEIVRSYARGTISKLETQVLSFNLTYYELVFLPMLFALSIAFMVLGSINLNSNNFDFNNTIFYLEVPFAVMLFSSVAIMLYPTMKIDSIYHIILSYPHSVSRENTNSEEGTDLLEPEKEDLIKKFFTKRNMDFILLVNIVIWILFLLYLSIIFFF